MSSVHTFWSSQFSAPLPTHLPPEHASLGVHRLPSLHAEVLLLNTQPVDVSQESSVQLLLSLHAVTLPTQTPLWQESPLVQGLLSVHATELYAWMQPWSALQLSVVQTWLSSQLTTLAGAAQTPAVQVDAACQPLLEHDAAMQV